MLITRILAFNLSILICFSSTVWAQSTVDIGDFYSDYGKPKDIPQSRLEQSRTCGNQFLDKLGRMFVGFRYKKFNLKDIYHKDFQVNTYLDSFHAMSKEERYLALKSLAQKADHNDKAFAFNYSSLLNKLKDEKLITFSELKNGMNFDFGATKYAISLDGSKIIYRISIDPIVDSKISAFFNKLNISSKGEVAEKLNEVFMKRNLSADDIDVLSTNLNKHVEKIDFSDSKNIDLLNEYLDYITIYSPKRYKNALENYSVIYHPEYFLENYSNVFEVYMAKFKLSLRNSVKYFDSKFEDPFNVYIKKVNKLEAKHQNRKLNKFKKENGGELTDNLRSRAAREARDEVEIYKALRKGCRNKQPNKIDYGLTKAISMKKTSFVKASTVGGVPLAVGAYVINHKNDEKGNKYWGGLTYDVLATIISGFASGIINSGPKVTFSGKFLQNELTYLWLPWVTGATYKAAFDSTDSQIEARLNQLMSDPNKKEKIDELVTYLHKEKFIDKVFTDATDRLEIEDLDIYNLSDEDTQDMLYELLSRQIYEENEGELIATGDKVLDRWLFYRSLDPLLMTKGIFYSLLVLQVLCESKNPKTGFAAAIGMITFDKLVFDQPVLWMRNKAVGQ